MKTAQQTQEAANWLNRAFRKFFGAAFLFFLAKGLVWLCIFAGLFKGFF